MKQQAELVDALSRLATTNSIDSSLENTFYRALKGKQPKNIDYTFDNYSVFSRALTELGQRYWQLGDLHKAVLCLDKAAERDAANALVEFAATEDDLKNLSTLLTQPVSELDRFLVNKSRFTPAMLTDIQATKWMRQGEYEKALATFNQLPANYWAQPDTADEYGYVPENYNLFTCDFSRNYEEWRRDTVEGSSPQCNKQQFAAQVIERLNKAKTDSKNAATYYYELGNGFSITPFWAYNNNLWEGSLIWTLNFGDYMPGQYPLNVPKVSKELYEAGRAFEKSYGSQERAVEYYKKAVDTSQDNELAAKAAYYVQFCLLTPLASTAEPDTNEVTFGKLLNKRYTDTDFYRQMAAKCPTLKDYQ